MFFLIDWLGRLLYGREAWDEASRRPVPKARRGGFRNGNRRRR